MWKSGKAVVVLVLVVSVRSAAYIGHVAVPPESLHLIQCISAGFAFTC